MTTPQLLELLSPDDLAMHVREELHTYLSGTRTDERYCLELIRRVATTQEADAWAVCYTELVPLVLSWLVRSARGREAMSVEGSDVLVNAAFTKLWMALRSGTKQFNTSGEFLSYLKACTASVLADWWRALPGTLLPGNKARAETPGSEGEVHVRRTQDFCAAATPLSDDPAVEVIACLSFLELYAIVQSALQNEAERTIGSLALLYDFPPHAIFQERQDLFASVEDVYRVKRNVLERLQRNKQVRAYVHANTGKEPPGTRRTLARGKEGKEGRPTETVLANEGHQQELAQRELLALLEQRTLAQARHDLLRVVEGQTQHIVDQTEFCKAGGVSYIRRMTRCGKPLCRRCREGMGHGPYWYAYKSVRGRTVTVYLGKDLVPLSWDGPTPRKARKADIPAQQREPAVIYRHQMSRCGKPRCRRCCEGIGHGPYWYAYQFVRGRSVRSYVGKTLPGASDTPVVSSPPA